jgi:hypothetical protein
VTEDDLRELRTRLVDKIQWSREEYLKSVLASLRNRDCSLSIKELQWVLNEYVDPALDEAKLTKAPL